MLATRTTTWFTVIHFSDRETTRRLAMLAGLRFRATVLKIFSTLTTLTCQRLRGVVELPTVARISILALIRGGNASFVTASPLSRAGHGNHAYVVSGGL